MNTPVLENLESYHLSNFRFNFFNLHLNSVIVLIDHNNSIVCITCNAGRKIKLTVSSSLHAELELVRSI